MLFQSPLTFPYDALTACMPCHKSPTSQAKSRHFGLLGKGPAFRLSRGISSALLYKLGFHFLCSLMPLLQFPYQHHCPSTCYIPSVLPQLPLSGNLLVYIPYLSTLNNKCPPEFLHLPRACDEFHDCFHVSPLQPWLSRLKAYHPISI
jgi:hypothetical protein